MDSVLFAEALLERRAELRAAGLVTAALPEDRADQRRDGEDVVASPGGTDRRSGPAALMPCNVVVDVLSDLLTLGAEALEQRDLR